MQQNIKGPSVDISMTTAVKCEAEGCDNDRFREVFLIRKISALVTASTKDSFMPIPTFECTKCGHINKEFALKTK
jgi:uncharacterized Zn finger protein